MDLRRLRAGEWVAAASGVALLVSLFLPWYRPEVCITGYPVRDVTDCPGLTGWESLAAIDVLLAFVAACGVLLAIVTAVQSVPAVPIALSALVTIAGALGVLLVLFRLADLPDDADRAAGRALAGARRRAWNRGSAPSSRCATRSAPAPRAPTSPRSRRRARDRRGGHRAVRRVHRRGPAAHRRGRDAPRQGAVDPRDDLDDGALRLDPGLREPARGQGHGRVRGLHQACGRGGGGQQLHRARPAGRGDRRAQASLCRRGPGG